MIWEALTRSEQLNSDLLANKWYLTPGQALDRVSPTGCPRQGVPDKVSPTLVSDASIGETCLTAIRLA